MSTDVATSVSVLRALADPLRWRIVELLATEELCVCHLVDELRVAQPLVSHHLKVLRETGLVDSHRHRYWTYYRLCPEVLAALGDQLCGMSDQVAPAGDQRRPCS